MTNLDVVRRDVLVQNPWGLYERAVETGYNFWTWWDEDPDSDQKICGTSSSALKATILRDLPEGQDSDNKADLIVSATRLLTNRLASNPEMLLNEIMFADATGQSLQEVQNLPPEDVVALQAFEKLIIENK